jgi:hypothetical protein
MKVTLVATWGGPDPEYVVRGGPVRRPTRGDAGLRGDTPVGPTGSGRRGPGRRRGDRHRGDLARPCPRRGAAAGTGDRIPGSRAGPGPALRRRGTVPGLRGVDGAHRDGATTTAPGPGLRRRVGDHRGTEPGRHGRLSRSSTNFGTTSGHPAHRDPGIQVEHLASDAAQQLLTAAAERLGQPCRRLDLTGRIEREVVTAAEGADLLVVARDGDRTHLGPRSLSPASRFVVDHTPAPSCWSGPSPHRASPPSRRSHHITGRPQLPQRVFTATQAIKIDSWRVLPLPWPYPLPRRRLRIGAPAGSMTRSALSG